MNEIKMEFKNSYQDIDRAESYAKLEFSNTYYLAYRDLPGIINKHINGRKALDFGCGTGRSTRFLQQYGFDCIGVDISENMINKAKEFNPKGDYRFLKEDGLKQLEGIAFDLILSVFTFDNIPIIENRISILKHFKQLLNNQGRIIMLDSTPEMYVNEWTSFSTSDFPQNKYAQSGDKVKIIITDIEDKRPVEDIIWKNEDYLECFIKAGLVLIDIYKPLAKYDEPYKWINETRIAPWVIYVLR